MSGITKKFLTTDNFFGLEGYGAALANGALTLANAATRSPLLVESVQSVNNVSVSATVRLSGYSGCFLSGAAIAQDAGVRCNANGLWVTSVNTEAPVAKCLNTVGATATRFEGCMDYSISEIAETVATLAALSPYQTRTSIDDTDSPYSLLVATDVLLVDSSGGPVTVNLPAIAGVDAGKRFTIVDYGGNAGANAITVDGAGAETINGAATQTMGVNYAVLELEEETTEWQIVARFAVTEGEVRTALAAASGAVNFNTQNITNVGTVDGVDVSNHSDLHDPGGADALTTAAPAIGIGASNAVGVAASLSRSDHDHTIRESGGQDLTLGAMTAGDLVQRTANTLATGLTAANVFLADGTVPMTANSDMGGFAITNVGNVDGADVSAVAAQVTALGAENTDGQFPVPVFGGVADLGTWTGTISAAGLRSVARTAAATNDGYWLEVPLPDREDAAKGREVVGGVVNYECATALADDVRLEFYRATMQADGLVVAGPTLLGGDQNAHYDANHDTPAKRADWTGAPEYHRAEVTLPAPAYFTVGQHLLVRFFVDGEAGGAANITLRQIMIQANETLVDLA
ncbi:MAG: hypothetical protein KJ578_15780 [Bacteroidetes bacterium]|nr:hypothetical protein [Bacteroidota bacterium]